MEFKKLMFSGLLGAAFVMGGSELQAQEKKVIKIGEHKPGKVKFTTQEPAKHQHQTKLFEKAAKLSAKASELAAAGKHQEAAAMARKAADLLNSGYQVNVAKPIGTTDAWVNKERIAVQEQHNKALHEAKRAQVEAKIAFEEAMVGRQALNQQQQLVETIELEKLHEHLGGLHEHLAELHTTIEGKNNIVLDLSNLEQLHELQGLQGVQELLALQELGNVQVLGELGYDQEGDGSEGECEDVQVFRYRSAPDGDWHAEFPGGKEEGAHSFFWSEDIGEAPKAMIWRGEGGDVNGTIKFEMRIGGEAPRVLRGNAPLALPAPGMKQGRYQLRTVAPEQCEEGGEWVVDLSTAPTVVDGIGEYRVLLSTDKEAGRVGEHLMKLHLTDTAECEVECTTECEVECTTECEVECDATIPQPDARKKMKVHVAPRAKGIGLPGMRVAPAQPAKPAKPGKGEAQILINEMQRELEALRNEIKDLRRTMGNDPLVMRYRSALKEDQVVRAVPVSTEL
jgi:hypothetical protein